MTHASKIEHPNFRKTHQYYVQPLLNVEISPPSIADGDQPSELHQVDIPSIPNWDCNRMMAFPRTRRLKYGVLPSQLCAGELTGGKDTCEGDSGGPLHVASEDPKCSFDVVGITSIGGICGTARKPGLYTRVSYYREWIESVIQDRTSEKRA